MTNTLLKFLVIVSVCFVAGCSKINEEEFLIKSAEWIGLEVKNGTFLDTIAYNCKKTDSLTSPYVTEIKAEVIRDGIEYSTATFTLAWEKPVGVDTPPRWVFKGASGKHKFFEDESTWVTDSLGPKVRQSNSELEEYTPSAYERVRDELAAALLEQPIMGEDEIE